MTSVPTPTALPLLFTPFKIRDITLPNRIVVPPMAQYCAVDGVANDFHLVHYGKFALGGAGLVMFGMVAATGIRILAGVDFKGSRNNLYIVAISIGAGMIPLVAPRWSQHMAHALHPLLESGILLTAITAVALNVYFNGASGDDAAAIGAAKLSEGH